MSRPHLHRLGLGLSLAVVISVVLWAQQPVSQSGTWTVESTGATPRAVASAASTNATSVKASAGRLLGMYLVNTTGTIYYVRLYDLATAPTCSSATGYVFSMPIPASTSGDGFSMSFPEGGIAFGTGIAYCLTGGPSSTDNTNAATGIYGALSYK